MLGGHFEVGGEPINPGPELKLDGADLSLRSARKRRCRHLDGLEEAVAEYFSELLNQLVGIGGLVEVAGSRLGAAPAILEGEVWVSGRHPVATCDCLDERHVGRVGCR